MNTTTIQPGWSGKITPATVEQFQKVLRAFFKQGRYTRVTQQGNEIPRVTLHQQLVNDGQDGGIHFYPARDESQLPYVSICDEDAVYQVVLERQTQFCPYFSYTHSGQICIQQYIPFLSSSGREMRTITWIFTIE